MKLFWTCITWKKLLMVKYSKNCFLYFCILLLILETMRKYPPLPFLQRQCAKDYPLPKSTHIIRQNQMVTISVLGLQRDPQYYPDPMKFDPERFNEEECAKRHPYTFLPFGEGPRICIGKNLITSNYLVY